MQSGYDKEEHVKDTNGFFDMWHDYMKLGTFIEKLCPQRRDVAGLQGFGGCVSMLEGGPQRHRRLPPSCSPTRTGSDTSGSANGDGCGFCKQNGETPEVYRGHRLKANDGRVMCPILRSYNHSNRNNTPAFKQVAGPLTLRSSA
ncbi:hypothetical protein GN956_G7940 [Arapaima gigas]